MYLLIVRLRTKLLVLLTHSLALPLLKIIRRPEIFPYTREQLSGFPEGTLGRDLVQLLEKNRLPLLTHYVKHDMKHILLQYPTSDKGEVCLQAFMLGNGHVSFPVTATLVYGWLTMPEHWRAFREAYRRGRKARPIAGWNWLDLAGEQTETLKRNIFGGAAITIQTVAKAALPALATTAACKPGKIANFTKNRNMQQKKFSLVERLSSFRYAFSGIRAFLLEQHNAILHLAATVAVVIAGFLAGLSALEWTGIVFAIGLVWMAELFNSAMEKICDLVSPEADARVKYIKDVAAAAVLVTAFTAALIAIIIFIHKLR